MAWSSFSSARKVRSCWAPLRMFRSVVRTNAPPLPGLTTWKSPSARLRDIPRFRSLVETAAIALCTSGSGLGSTRQGPAPRGGDHDGVLDADPTDAGERSEE